MALLEVRGLVKFYTRRKVVDGVSFDVNPGEVVGLLGPNGAGKTTSFRMTTGQVPPHAGEVIFNDQDVTQLPMYKRARLGMGYLSQEPSVFRRLTVEQNILAILEALPYSRSLGRRLNRRERWARTEEVLGRFNLKHVRHTSAGRASGGEKRRLEIARALVCEPMLILLDEPFAAVDPKTTEDIRANIRELAQQGIGILLTDHNVREVLKITDRSYLIKDGQVVTAGTPQQLIRDPIAINEYLGSTFTDDLSVYGLAERGDRSTEPVAIAIPADPSPSPSPSPSPAPESTSTDNAVVGMHEVLEHEMIHRLIEQLVDPIEAQRACVELTTRGLAAVPALINALERRDLLMRQRAHQLLRYLLNGEVPFDPAAPEEARVRQVTALRRLWDQRKAG